MSLWRIGRRGVGLALLGLLVLWSARSAADEAAEKRLLKDITYLASAECEGRGITTQGINKAAEYIANEFKLAGLKPAGHQGTYFQHFTVSGSGKLDGPNVLKLRGPLGQEIELKQGTDFQVMGISGSGNVKAPLVFAGFGATAKDIGYDDYKGIDVAGKVVVILRHTPRWENKFAPFDGPAAMDHAALEKKQALAEINKAAAVLLVNDHTEDPKGDPLMPFNYILGTPSSIPAVHIRRSIVDAVFRSSLGVPLLDVEQAIDRDMQPRSAPLSGWTATLETRVNRQSIQVKNVIGVVDGSGPLAHETVVVGAHYDHLGYGGRGSRAKNPNKKEIHHGADDNGSGTTAVLELARRFAQIKDRQGRRIVFMAFSAEESGLLGSRYYCNKDPLFPLADTVAMVNLDMVGRLSKDKLLVEGTGTSKHFDKLVEQWNPGLQLSKKAGVSPFSDHDSFYKKRIPVIFYWTGTHEDYHRPSDTADRINIQGMSKITDLSEKTIAYLARQPERPDFIQVASTIVPKSGKGPKLGIIPNYDENKEGVLIGGVTDNGPAAKAGMKTGDLIIAIAGKPVTNLNTYMVLMAQQQPGQAIEVGILRDGRKLNLKVVPK